MPVHDLYVFEGGVVGEVGRDQRELVDPGDGGDLAVREGRRPADAGQTGTFRSVPPGRPRIVGQDRYGRPYDLAQIFFDGRASGRRGQPVATEEQLAILWLWKQKKDEQFSERIFRNAFRNDLVTAPG